MQIGTTKKLLDRKICINFAPKKLSSDNVKRIKNDVKLNEHIPFPHSLSA